MTKILSTADLPNLADMEQNLLFSYMNDLTERRESFLGILFIFVYFSMAGLLYLVWLTTPSNAAFSSPIEMMWTFAGTVFTVATIYLVCLRKPWKYSFYNKRVLSARQFFLEHFDMNISALTPNDIWQGVVLVRANQKPYVTFPVPTNASKAGEKL